MKRLACCIAVIVASIGFLSPSYAQNDIAAIEPNAWGTVLGVMVCDFDPDAGLTVRVADFADQLSGFTPQQGDRCLPLLLQLPAAYIHPPVWVQPGAATVPTPRDLVWVFVRDSRIRAIVGCAPADGALATRFVDLGEDMSPSPLVGTACSSARAALQADGWGQALGPTAVAFSSDDDGNRVGEVKWFNAHKGYGFITPEDGDVATLDMVGCGLNDQDLLVATSRESSVSGVLAVGEDHSCVATLSTLPGALLTASPVSVPTAKKPVIDTSDPGCLIWDLVGGTIGQ